MDVPCLHIQQRTQVAALLGVRNTKGGHTATAVAADAAWRRLQAHSSSRHGTSRWRAWWGWACRRWQQQQAADTGAHGAAQAVQALGWECVGGDSMRACTLRGCCPVCGGRFALFVALCAAGGDAECYVQSLYRSVLVNTSFAAYDKGVQGVRQRGWAQGRTCNPGHCNRCSLCGTQPRRMLCCLFLRLLLGWGWGLVQIEAVAAAAHAARHTCGHTAGCCWVWWGDLDWNAAGKVSACGVQPTCG